MCGFTGFFSNSDQLINRDEIIKKMSDTIIHRGPDSAGKYVDNNVALGFRRLSIVDLADGNQPMFNEDGSLVLVFKEFILKLTVLSFLDLVIRSNAVFSP